MANAIRWAQEHLGVADYAGRCLAFVEDAYEKGNYVEIFGGSSAKESADEYKAERYKGEPPAGAFVFYDCFGQLSGEYKNWGHVGLHIGEGQVIHAGIKFASTTIATYKTSPLRPVGQSHNSSAGRQSSASSWAIAKRHSPSSVWRLSPMIV